MGEVDIGPSLPSSVSLAKHRARAHTFTRGVTSDVLIIAQQNIDATSVKFNLGFGLNEHFCASTSPVYVVPAEADAQWVLNGESQCVYLALPKQDVTEFLQGFDVAEPTEHVWRLASRGFDERLVHELVLRLWQEVTRFGSTPLLESSCRIAVLHSLARRFENSPSKKIKTAPKLHPIMLSRVLEAIHELPSEGLSVEQLAQIAGLSPFHFSRLFQNSTGRTPYRYYDELRFQRACELLANGSAPITAIGHQLGFASASQFSRAFSRQAGCSPRTYRTQYRHFNASEVSSRYEAGWPRRRTDARASSRINEGQLASKCLPEPR